MQDASKHELYQALPTGEAQVLSQCCDVLEEHVSAGKLTSQQRVLFVDELEQGVKQKADDIQRQKCLGEVATAMTEVVFEMITFGLEHIVVLVFHLPAGASITHNGFDSRVCDFKIGDEGVQVDYFARVFSGDHQFTPVDFQGRRVSP